MKEKERERSEREEEFILKSFSLFLVLIFLSLLHSLTYILSSFSCYLNHSFYSILLLDLGKDICLSLASKGCKVVINYNSNINKANVFVFTFNLIIH